MTRHFDPISPSHSCNTKSVSALPYRDLGEEIIRNNQVAVVIAAGGDGSRLGHNGPKGTFNLGHFGSIFNVLLTRFVRDSSAFSLEKLIVVIITSPRNHEDTVAHIRSLPVASLCDIHFITQTMLPALSQDKKTNLYSGPNLEPILAPSGNADFYPVMLNSGMIAKLRGKGVKYLSYVTVDNVSSQPLDPIALGFMAKESLSVVNKVLRRNDPNEKVGVCCLIDDAPGVLEYTELSDEVRNELGKFPYSNIGLHIFSVDFVAKIASSHFDEIPFHWAHKAISYYDTEKEMMIVPEEANGWKREKFIFDAFQFCKSEEFGIYEVSREQFTPIKDRVGKDSPDNAIIVLESNFGVDGILEAQ